MSGRDETQYNDFDELDAQIQRDMEERRLRAELEYAGLPVEPQVAPEPVEYRNPKSPEPESSAWRPSIKNKRSVNGAVIEKIMYTAGGLVILWVIFYTVTTIFKNFT